MQCHFPFKFEDFTRYNSTITLVEWLTLQYPSLSRKIMVTTWPYNTTLSEINGFNVTPLCKYVPPMVFHAVLCDDARVLLIVHSNNFVGNT